MRDVARVAATPAGLEWPSFGAGDIAGAIERRWCGCAYASSPRVALLATSRLVRSVDLRAKPSAGAFLAEPLAGDAPWRALAGPPVAEWSPPPFRSEAVGRKLRAAASCRTRSRSRATDTSRCTTCASRTRRSRSGRTGAARRRRGCASSRRRRGVFVFAILLGALVLAGHGGEDGDVLAFEWADVGGEALDGSLSGGVRALGAGARVPLGAGGAEAPGDATLPPAFRERVRRGGHYGPRATGACCGVRTSRRDWYPARRPTRYHPRRRSRLGGRRDRRDDEGADRRREPPRAGGADDAADRPLRGYRTDRSGISPDIARALGAPRAWPPWTRRACRSARWTTRRARVRAATAAPPPGAARARRRHRGLRMALLPSQATNAAGRRARREEEDHVPARRRVHRARRVPGETPARGDEAGNASASPETGPPKGEGGEVLAHAALVRAAGGFGVTAHELALLASCAAATAAARRKSPSGSPRGTSPDASGADADAKARARRGARVDFFPDEKNARRRRRRGRRCPEDARTNARRARRARFRAWRATTSVERLDERPRKGSPRRRPLLAAVDGAATDDDDALRDARTPSGSGRRRGGSARTRARGGRRTRSALRQTLKTLKTLNRYLTREPRFETERARGARRRPTRRGRRFWRAGPTLPRRRLKNERITPGGGRRRPRRGEKNARLFVSSRG